jgi:hypothetical protein
VFESLSSSPNVPSYFAEVDRPRSWVAALDAVQVDPAWIEWLDVPHKTMVNTPAMLKKGRECRSDLTIREGVAYRYDENCAHNDFLVEAVDAAHGKAVCALGADAGEQAIAKFAAQHLRSVLRLLSATPHQANVEIGWQMHFAAWSSKAWQGWRREYHRRHGIKRCTSKVIDEVRVTTEVHVDVYVEDGVEYPFEYEVANEVVVRNVVEDETCNCLTPFSETVAELRAELDRQLWRRNSKETNPAKFVRGNFVSKLIEIDRARRTAMNAVAKPEDALKSKWAQKLSSDHYRVLLGEVLWQAGSDAPNHTYGSADFNRYVAEAFAESAAMQISEAHSYVEDHLPKLQAEVEQFAPWKTEDGKRVSYWAYHVEAPAGRREGRWVSYDGVKASADSDDVVPADRMIAEQVHLDYTADPADEVAEAEQLSARERFLAALRTVIDEAQQKRGSVSQKATFVRARLFGLIDRGELPAVAAAFLASLSDDDLIGTFA